MTEQPVVKVVVDGAVDLPLPRPGVVSVPAKVFKDGQPSTSDLHQFWSALRSDPLGWSTAPPTISELAAAYLGEQPVLALHVSGELSSTLDHAREAAAASGTEVSVCDSRSLSIGAGLVATRIGGPPLDLPAASKRTGGAHRPNTHLRPGRPGRLLTAKRTTQAARR